MFSPLTLPFYFLPLATAFAVVLVVKHFLCACFTYGLLRCLGAARAGSIAISGGKIAAVGEVTGSATRTIDAKGRTVAPGFIDLHSHSDMPLITDGNGQSKIRQGVTTEVIGESGSVAPRKAPSASQNWTDFIGYFAAIEKGGISPNLVSYVGLGTWIL